LIIENCGGMEERFQCANKKCIYDYKVCNGRNDCEDGSDETDETCAGKLFNGYKYREAALWFKKWKR